MKENKNMTNAAANNNFNKNEGGIVMTTGTMTMDVFAGTVKEVHIATANGRICGA